MGFNVPEGKAQGYMTGIREGGLLFWIRICGVRVQEARSILRDQQDAIVASHVYWMPGMEVDRVRCPALANLPGRENSTVRWSKPLPK